MKIIGIILIVYFVLMLLLYAHYHGKPKTGKYNFWVGLIATSILATMVYFTGVWN